jgi:hypothetical protein
LNPDLGLTSFLELKSRHESRTQLILPLSEEGSTFQTLDLAGRKKDQVLSFVGHKYDPASGRFMTEDRHTGD